MWFLYFMLGIFLAYLATSKRVRRAIFRRNGTRLLQRRIQAEEADISIKPRIPIGDESEVQEWLDKNPDLKKANRGKV